jgi:hypothetical protein
MASLAGGVGRQPRANTINVNLSLGRSIKSERVGCTEAQFNSTGYTLLDYTLVI